MERIHSMFERPLAAFYGHAHAVQQTNPALAQLLGDIATYTRVCAERSVRAGRKPLLDELRRVGFTDTAVGTIDAALHAGHLAFGAAAVGDRIGEGLRAVLPKKTGKRTAFEVLQSEMTSASREAFGGGEVEDVPVRDDDRRKDIRYTIVASIDRPSIVTKNTYSGKNIVAATSAYDWDDIIATEITYVGDVETGFARDNLPENAPVVPPGYRSTIEKDLPDGFFENLRPGWTIKNFVFSQTEVNRFMGADLLYNLLKKNKDKISKQIDKLAEKAGTAASAYATANGFAPIAKATGNLTEQVVKQGLNELFDVVLDLLDGSKFEIISITHFVNWNPPAAPESTFTLSSSGAAPMRLYAVQRDAANPLNQCTLQTTPDGKKPAYAPFGPPVEFLRQSRYMVGASKDPAQPAPSDLWDKVGKQKEAAVWADTNANEGFHVLTAVKEIGGDGLYVWGLRADVRGGEFI